MNILVIGPGKDPNRFGTYFCNKAEQEGHTVYKYSYRIVPEYSEPKEIEQDFKGYIQQIDRIDLLLYNCIGGFYPGVVEDYKPGHTMKWDEWYKGIMINGAMPHMIGLNALSKMDNKSGMVFMTSSASYLIYRDNYLHMAGYFGTKSVLNHLSRAFAECNEVGATVTTFAPHIPYDEPELAVKVMDALYNKATNLTQYDNGKIIECYPPNARLEYYKSDGRFTIEEQ